jgi:hypothetical protein
VAEIPNLVTEERMDLASSPNLDHLHSTDAKNAAMNIVNSMPGLPAGENANPYRGRSGAVTF